MLASAAKIFNIFPALFFRSETLQMMKNNRMKQKTMKGKTTDNLHVVNMT